MGCCVRAGKSGGGARGPADLVRPIAGGRRFLRQADSREPVRYPVPHIFPRRSPRHEHTASRSSLACWSAAKPIVACATPCLHALRLDRPPSLRAQDLRQRPASGKLVDHPVEPPDFAH
jgi:hypothetical protein